MSKMRELDTPVQEASIEECGEPMGMPSPMGMDHKPDTPPPSMSVNINAQGMDDIAELMKLLTKVNPDMINQKSEPLHGLSPEPSIASIKPEMPALKMLPLDTEPEHGMEVDIDGESPEDESKGFDPEQPDGGGAGAGDIGKDDEQEDEAFGNTPAGAPGPETYGIKAAVPDGNDLNKPKQMTKHSYRQGDNPMAMPESDLRAHIRAELLQRLAEADMGKHNNGKTTGFKAVAKKAAKEYGSKEAGERVAGAVKAKMAKAGKL